MSKEPLVIFTRCSEVTFSAEALRKLAQLYSRDPIPDNARVTTRDDGAGKILDVVVEWDDQPAASAVKVG